MAIVWLWGDKHPTLAMLSSSVYITHWFCCVQILLAANGDSSYPTPTHFCITDLRVQKNVVKG